MKSEARNYVATHSGVLDDKRADFHRRKESLEKLEKQLADYQALLDEEDREATERRNGFDAASSWRATSPSAACTARIARRGHLR